MSVKTEDIAWKLVGLLLVLLQSIALAYIASVATSVNRLSEKIERQNTTTAKLTERVVAVEMAQRLRGIKIPSSSEE